MLYKFQNDRNKNSKWLQTKKARQKTCTWKIFRDPIIAPKMHCNVEYWRPDVNCAKVQTTWNYVQFDP